MVEVDLQAALVRDGDAVVAVAHVEGEVRLRAEEEVGRDAHVEVEGAGAVALEFAGEGDVADAGDPVGGEPARGVVGFAGRGDLERGDADLIGLEEVALEGEGHSALRRSSGLSPERMRSLE